MERNLAVGLLYKLNVSITRYIMKLSHVLFVFLLFPSAVYAEYVFTAPPRETAEKGEYTYAPIAEYLTKVTGEKFTYNYPGSWKNYTDSMKQHKYDMVFDGPHFVSWRVKNIEHTVIAKLPQLHIWRLVVLKENSSQLINLSDLVGKKICAPKSPNFGTLTMLSHFSNPDEQPIHIITKGWRNGYDGVLSQKCHAAVMPKTNHNTYDPDNVVTTALHTHLPYPNQAFTIGPNISNGLSGRIQQALIADEGQYSMAKLRRRYSKGSPVVSAEDEEYEDISLVLKRANGFN